MQVIRHLPNLKNQLVLKHQYVQNFGICLFVVKGIREFAVCEC